MLIQNFPSTIADIYITPSQAAEHPGALLVYFKQLTHSFDYLGLNDVLSFGMVTIKLQDDGAYTDHSREL